MGTKLHKVQLTKLQSYLLNIRQTCTNRSYFAPLPFIAMDCGIWLENGKVQFHDTKLTAHEQIWGKNKKILFRKKTIQKRKNCNPQEHLELRNTLHSRAKELEIVMKPDTLLEEPCGFILRLGSYDSFVQEENRTHLRFKKLNLFKS